MVMWPDIVNHNNAAIGREFDNIYDSSLNRLNKSLYAPTGSVKAHFGEFVNLSAEYLTLKNVDSLKYSIRDAVTSIIGETIDTHNVLKGRFVDSNNERVYHATAICHDASAIAFDASNNLYQYVSRLSNAVEDVSAMGRVISVGMLDISTDMRSIRQYLVNLDAEVEDISIANRYVQVRVNRMDTSVVQNINDISVLKTDVSTTKNTVRGQGNIINLLQQNVNNLDGRVTSHDDMFDSIHKGDYMIKYGGTDYSLAELVETHIWK